MAKELSDARTVAYANETGLDEAVKAIHRRFTYRMHDLGEFMKGLLQRYTQWHNRAHSRTGRLWEDRFKSLIVEDGVAAKTIAAYIDLNQVSRALWIEAKNRGKEAEGKRQARKRGSLELEGSSEERFLT